MADDDGADQAIRELNGTVIDGQEIKVDNARGGGGGGGGRGKMFVLCVKVTPHHFIFLHVEITQSFLFFSNFYKCLQIFIFADK